MIKEKFPPGSIIPKPDNRADYIVKGWGIRRAEEALIYLIPNHKDPSNPHQKGVNITEWKKSYYHILGGAEFDRDWFERHLPRCKEEGDCNFTTIGGILQMLGFVYYERGIYYSRVIKKI